MGTSEIFLIAMTINLTVPYLVWRLGRTEYYAPIVVVQIVGGILLETPAWRAQWFETGEKKIRDQTAILTATSCRHGFDYQYLTSHRYSAGNCSPTLH